jgi:hypothetical protein
LKIATQRKHNDAHLFPGVGLTDRVSHHLSNLTWLEVLEFN